MSPDEYTAAQEAEYGTYVALAPIFVGAARAFSPGHPVPVSHIADHPEWLEQRLVGKVGDVPEPTEPTPAPPQGEPIVIGELVAVDDDLSE